MHLYVDFVLWVIAVRLLIHSDHKQAFSLSIGYAVAVVTATSLVAGLTVLGFVALFVMKFLVTYCMWRMMHWFNGYLIYVLVLSSMTALNFLGIAFVVSLFDQMHF